MLNILCYGSLDHVTKNPDLKFKGQVFNKHISIPCIVFVSFYALNLSFCLNTFLHLKNTEKVSDIQNLVLTLEHH